MAPTASTAPLLRDVFSSKTSSSTSDYVLKLAEAVTEEGGTASAGSDPQVYRTGSLFQDIRSHRERMGDAASIQGLAAASPEAGSGDADGDWRSLARHHGRREHMSDTIQAVASLLSQHNCLSLALDEAALLSASALLPMWTRGWWTWAGYKADAGERLCLAAVHLTECFWPGSGEAGSCT